MHNMHTATKILDFWKFPYTQDGNDIHLIKFIPSIFQLKRGSFTRTFFPDPSFYGTNLSNVYISEHDDINGFK